MSFGSAPGVPIRTTSRDVAHSEPSVNELIPPDRRLRPAEPSPWATEPRRGICCAWGEGSLLVSFDTPDDLWRRFPGEASGTLPPGLCDEVRRDLERLARAPMEASRHPTEVSRDQFDLLIDDEIVSFVVDRGFFFDCPLVRWRQIVGDAID